MRTTRGLRWLLVIATLEKTGVMRDWMNMSSVFGKFKLWTANTESFTGILVFLFDCLFFLAYINLNLVN